MNIRKPWFWLFVVLAAGFVWLPIASAQSVITSSPISSSPGIYLIHSITPIQLGPFPMNNLLVVGPEGALLVDTMPPAPGVYPLFLGVIHGRTAGKPVKTLINTSWHFDHTGLNAAFRQIEGTERILAHWRAGEYLKTARCMEDLPMICFPVLPDAAQPTEGVHGEMTLQAGDERVTLKTVENAHSGADLVVYLERANIVYAGDLYFAGMYPIIDRTGGGTVNGTLHGLNQILARIDDQTIVIPSHGPVGNRQALRDFADMIKTTRDMVRALIARGFSETQVMSDSSFAGLDAQWGQGILSGPLFRRIIYRDLEPSR